MGRRGRLLLLLEWSGEIEGTIKVGGERVLSASWLL